MKYPVDVCNIRSRFFTIYKLLLLQLVLFYTQYMFSSIDKKSRIFRRNKYK
jgi:hypothetical protein